MPETRVFIEFLKKLSFFFQKSIVDINIIYIFATSIKQNN